MVARTGQFKNRLLIPKLMMKTFSLCVGIGGLFFCAKSLRDFKAVPRRFPSLQKIATTSEKVTIAVAIDLDGTTVKIGGTIYPSTILNAMASNGTSLDFKSNDKYDQVSIILESTCCKKRQKKSPIQETQ